MSEIDVLTVRLPEKIVSWLDFLVEQGLYKSRAEVIRDMVRNHILLQAKENYKKGNSLE